MPADRRTDPAAPGSQKLDRRLFALALASAGALFLGLGHPALRGLLFTETDLGYFHIPMRFFYAGALDRGESFLWFPYEFLGFYLQGEGQAVMTHPLNLLAYRLLPFSAAFNFEFLRSYALLFLGTFLFLRHRALPRSAAAFGALLFAFCGFSLLHFMHINMVAVAAHLPLALLAIDVALTSPKRSRRALAAVALALITASQILHGHPQTTWISLLAEFGFALVTALRAGRPSGLAWLLAAQLVALALGGVQILPQWETLALSARVATPDDYAYAISPHPINLVQLVAPYFFTERAAGAPGPQELSFYAGAVPLALIAGWLAQPRRAGSRRALALAALVLAALALLLSLGEAGGLYSLQASLPLIGHFRGPARHLVLFQLGVAVAAAVAFAEIARTPARSAGAPAARRGPVRSLVLFAPLAAGLAVAVLGGLARRGVIALPYAAEVAGAPRLVLGLALLTAATGAVWAAARGRRGALFALVILAALDHGAYGLTYVYRQPPQRLEDFIASGALPEWGSGYRVRFGPPVLTLRGVPLVYGYAAMPPRLRLNTGGVTRPKTRAERRSLVQTLRVLGVGGAFRRPIPDPLPRARLVSEAVVTFDLVRQMGEIDVDTAALVDAPLSLGGGAPGSARIVHDEPGRIAIETRAESRQLLVVAEAYHPGWRVAIDGARAELQRAYGDLLACVVEPGEHRVALRFAPASFGNGLRLTSLGFLLLALLGGAAARFG